MNKPLCNPQLDRPNNRILVRNSHKCVFKKVLASRKDDWCQRYISVASSKLSDPNFTHKLPFSLNKRVRNDTCSLLAERNILKSRVNTTSAILPQPNKRLKVLAIHDNHEFERQKENRSYKTMENDSSDCELLRAGRETFKLFMSSKKGKGKKMRNLENGIRSVGVKGVKRGRDEFELEPWETIEDDEEGMKENRL